jgi:hypothetical protein
MKSLTLTVTVLMMILALNAEAGRKQSIEREVAPGVIAAFKHKVIIEEETWPSALSETRAGRECIRLESRGGFLLHARIRENPDDYVMCVVYIEDGGSLELCDDCRFVFRYGDREVSSKEMLLTDSILEKRVFSTLESRVVLTEESGSYAKVKSGGYLVAVRFDEGALDGRGGWVPDSFELRRG